MRVGGGGEGREEGGEGEGGSGDDEYGLRGRDDGNEELRARDYLLWKGCGSESVAVQAQRGLEIVWRRERNEGEKEWEISSSENDGSRRVFCEESSSCFRFSRKLHAIH